MLRRRRHVRLDRDVAARLGGRRVDDGLDVHEPVGLRARRARGDDRSERLAGEHLGALDVRLVERVDAQHGAGVGRRDLPEHHLARHVGEAEHVEHDGGVAGVDEPVDRRVERGVPAQVREHAVVAVDARAADRLLGDGHDARAVLAGRLREQLLEPEAEHREVARRGDGQLVLAGADEAAEDRAEAQRRVRVRRHGGSAAVAHRARRLDERRDRDPGERRRHEARTARGR